jgi:1D-myo-inositol-triphosphate 3-kinase
VYEALGADPAMRDIVPRYFREVEYHGEKFIELQDLLHGFSDPHVMDVKMGTRTFLESEVQKTTARPDLYQKVSNEYDTPGILSFLRPGSTFAPDY